MRRSNASDGQIAKKYESPATKTGLKRPPGSKGLPLLGSLLKARDNPLGFALNLTRRYGDISYFRIGVYRGYLLNHPDYFKHVLQSSQSNYDKRNYNYKKLKPVLGEGLITGSGDHWQRERRLIQPVFHHNRIAKFGSATTKAAGEMLQHWDSMAVKGEAVDVADEMMRLTLRVVNRALFSVNISAESDTIAEAFTILNRDISYRFQNFFTAPLWIPTRRNRIFKKARNELDRVVYEIIRRRRKEDNSRDDLVGMLLAARDEKSGEGMSDRQLRDEVMTLLLAGHETTANLLAWTCYLISQHPDVIHNLRSEQYEVLGERTPAVEDLPKLQYSKSVLQESLRLYPPVWIISRRAIADDEIDGYEIPAGTTVTLCSYALHRHPGFWKEPELFFPERFISNSNKEENKNAYFPFGGGPRSCIGSHFAMMEAQLILAMIIQRYSFRLAPGQLVEPEPLVTLRPRYGLKMILEPWASKSN